MIIQIASDSSGYRTIRIIRVHGRRISRILNPYLASQRTTNDPIRGTRDWTLFQHFRFGRHQLEYRFPVADGTYRIELYFTEPLAWYGREALLPTVKGCAYLMLP